MILTACCILLLVVAKSFIVLGFTVFYSSRRRHTRWPRDWSSVVCSSDLTCSLAPWVISLAFISQRGLRLSGLRSDIQLQGDINTTQKVREHPVPSPPGTMSWTPERWRQ